MHTSKVSNLNDVTSKKKRILITGANGFTGRHACAFFADLGYMVYALVRKPATFPHNNIQIILCDLEDKESIKNVIESTQPHFVLHLAGQNSVPASWSNPIDTLRVNIMCTSYLFNAIRTKNKDCRTVVAGSILQSNPSNISAFQHPYGLSKTIQSILSEVYASLYNLDVLIAKPSNLIGPGHSAGVCSILAQKIALMEQGKEEKKIVIDNLLAQRDFLDVERCN
ncbi:UDP-glucose 4-epimerase OS=Ureibacillus acetophenoni OX=614649 GN=SAMN05877842_104142 PE=4 SV=1 [Ureibacillus acetophenoni]